MILLGLIPLLGSYMAKVFRGERSWFTPLLSPLERLTYRLGGINPKEEMGWKRYLKALLLFNLLGLVLLLLLQLLQGVLPLNPQGLPRVSWPIAINTAISFVTNTNWQAYSGETTMSYLTQMSGLTVQNFLSAATGNAALLALIRGISRRTAETIGNFWVDLVRTVVYLLLPLSLILALLLVSQGVIQSFAPYVKAETLEGATQIIPQGPVASQIAIKQLGTNGGGFFGANSAHPFENPNAFTNFLETLVLFLIPAAVTYTYSLMIQDKKQGWLLLAAMALLWVAGWAISIYSEHLQNPLFPIGSNLEGKELRFGVNNSILWSTLTTATANGSTNAMLDSLTPWAGGISLFNIMLGEIIFGGVGVGLCSMLMFVLLTVFLTGLMVGRTPEYLGKKIEKKEMQWVSIAILVPTVLILAGAGIASVLPGAVKALGNRGPHGLSEILYAFASTTGNNGSAFGGLDAGTKFYNSALTFCMLLGRLSIIIPSIAIAGTLVRKKATAHSEGAFGTNNFLFLLLLIGVILIVGALSFFPALCLGPIVEQQLMLNGEVS